MAEAPVGAKGTEAATEDEAMQDAAPEQDKAVQMNTDEAKPAPASAAAVPAEAEPLTGYAAGQAAGNIHLAGGDAEVMELGAASLEAQVHASRPDAQCTYLRIEMAALIRARVHAPLPRASSSQQGMIRCPAPWWQPLSFRKQHNTP